MACFFNELSFTEAVSSLDALRSRLRQLKSVADLAGQSRHPFYIHRKNLYECRVCGLDLRQAMNQKLTPDEKRIFFRLLDRAAPALPEDSAIPEGCRFRLHGRDIGLSGLAECAYWQYMGDEAFAVSLPCPAYAESPLPVEIMEDRRESVSVPVRNIHDLLELKEELDLREPDIQSWDDILRRAGQLPHVQIEPSVRQSLQKEPYEHSLGKAVWQRLQQIEEMSASSNDVYLELDQKYCHGERAIFSEESDTRKNMLGEKFYFTIQGQKTLCSFHGKIRHRAFRIHMDRHPQPNQECHIVYIGRKIL